MTRRVYVGNLPSSCTESTLSSKFSEHGKVTGVKVIIDRITGRSLGYGFVDMASKADANRVIDELDGDHYDGWRLTVRTAMPST